MSPPALRVTGAVRTPLELPGSLLARLPRSRGPLSPFRPEPTAEGVPVERLLEMAGPSPGATHVRVIASDGFAGVAALEEFRRLGLLLLRLGEGPLREDQGGPLRLVMPGSSNPCASVKGVVAIEVREGPFRETSSNHPDVPMVRKG